MSKENRVSDELAVQRVRMAAEAVTNNINEFGTITDGELIDSLDAAMSALCRSKPVAGVEVKDALEFYRVEAEAAAKAVPAKQTDAMAAIVTVMSLDGGRRARGAIAALSTLSLPAQEPLRQVTEFKMTPIAEGMPKRDEMRGEQTILTYNDRVGAWDISFMEAGWDDYDAGFALGVTHWLDISEMWPGVTAQVSSFYASPQPEAVITEEMVERAAQWMALDHVSISDRAEYSWDATDDLWKAAWRKKARTALTAALKEA